MKQNDELEMREEEVDLAELEVPENLQRQTVDEARVMELAQSIRDIGLINRVIVRKKGNGYELVAGYRRFLAFAKLQRETIPARVISARSGVAEQITLDENLEREAINAVDEALWLGKIKARENLSIEDVARKVGKSKAFVSGRLAILEYGAEVVAALAEGGISLAIARELDKCKDAAEVGRILALVVENGATANVVRYWVSSANATKELRESEGYEEDLIADAAPEYEAPKLFCDICESPTSYMESKFIRMCPDCYEVAKANLAPNVK